MLEAFKKHIATNLSLLRESKILVAVSGGLDSVVLAQLCDQMDWNISLAHCNFHLRGPESDADENFVVEFAEELDLEVYVQHFDTVAYSEDRGISIQMAARELRYQWFNDLAEHLQFEYILTAHHADDNLETFLINLTRGTGLNGITGIPEVCNKIVRPLLPFSREVLEAYAFKNNLKWREDSTNASTKYLRNKLRHDVIPILKEINPQLLQNFQMTISHLQDSQHLLEDYMKKVKEEVSDSKNGQVRFSIDAIKKLSNPKSYLFQLLKDYNFTAWDDVVELMDAQSGKQVFSSTHRLLKDREVLILTELSTSTNESSITVRKQDNEVRFALGTLFFDKVMSIEETSKNSAYVDLNQLKFPLKIRKWKQGDVFYPLGMKGKKKLSKYFKDEKLSLIEKENSYVLLSDDQVVWIIGERPDERYKKTDHTTELLKIELQE